MPTQDEVARWLYKKLMIDGELSNRHAIHHVKNTFGDADFLTINEYGKPALDPDVLKTSSAATFTAKRYRDREDLKRRKIKGGSLMRKIDLERVKVRKRFLLLLHVNKGMDTFEEPLPETVIKGIIQAADGSMQRNSADPAPAFGLTGKMNLISPILWMYLAILGIHHQCHI